MESRTQQAELLEDAKVMACWYDEEDSRWFVEFTFGQEEYTADVFVHVAPNGDMTAQSNGVGHIDNKPVSKFLEKQCEQWAKDYIERGNV